ncbi:Fatty acid-binding protein-like 1 [Homarus americanus]|uniref:Fatty acid-binding protein-like 1 n=1 Tax=Homarus americanus TaxID=6706 RepID=A0A8J5K5U0_HOMAM|nr:Fatty acid-binding protein-like 1 [Homarus americanus]
MVEFNGTYKHDKDENFQEVLAKIGIGFMLRKVMMLAKPSVEVKVEGDIWTILAHTPIKTITITFKLGQETDMEFLTGGRQR